jgi:hypothetical protein
LHVVDVTICNAGPSLSHSVQGFVPDKINVIAEDLVGQEVNWGASFVFLGVCAHKFQVYILVVILP